MKSLIITAFLIVFGLIWTAHAQDDSKGYVGRNVESLAGISKIAVKVRFPAADSSKYLSRNRIREQVRKELSNSGIKVATGEPVKTTPTVWAIVSVGEMPNEQGVFAYSVSIEVTRSFFSSKADKIIPGIIWTQGFFGCIGKKDFRSLPLVLNHLLEKLVADLHNANSIDK